MKLTARDLQKKPLSNMQLKLQIKGKETLNIKTDSMGQFQLDDKYRGDQLAILLSGGQLLWTLASDGAVLSVDKEKLKEKETLNR